MRATILYGTTYGATARAAEALRERLERRLGTAVPCLDVGWTRPGELRGSDLLVLGTSTWDDGGLPEDWRAAVDELAALHLTGTLVALFGTGDQVAYPDTFVDGMGLLARAVESAGATLIGAWPARDYRVVASRALRGGTFVGLPLDEDNQPDLSAARMDGWVDVVVRAARVPA